MATIASLIVNVEANTAKLVKDVGEIQGSLDKVGSIAGKLGGVLAGAFSIGAITGAVNKFVDMTGALTDLSAKTGISTTELQKLKYAAEQNGGTLEGVTKAIGRMGKSLVEGNSGTVGAMKALGLSIADVRNMDPATAFATIGDAIAKVPNPLERSKLAMDLFGKSGTDLLPMMTGNMAKLMKAAEDLGIVLDTKTLAAGDELGDTLGALGLVGEAVIAKVLAPMLPAFQAVATAMLSASGVVDWLRDAFDALMRAALITVKGIIDAAIKVGEFAQKIPGLGKAFSETSSEMRIARDASTFLEGAIKGLEQGTQTATTKTKDFRAPIATLGEEQTKAAKAAEAHAKAIRGITADLQGDGAIKAAKDMLAALKPIPDIHKLTEEAQAKVHKTMSAALDVYRASGKEAPEAMRMLWVETLKLPPVVYGVGAAFKDLGQHLDISIPKMATFGVKVHEGIAAGSVFGPTIENQIPTVKKFDDHIGALATSLANMAQIMGESMGSMVRGLATLVTSFDAAQKSQKAFTEGQEEYKDKDGSKINGLVGMASGIMGMATAAISAGKAIKGMWDHFFGAAGRSVVTGFAETMGGFDAVHAKLLTLGTAGEDLWIKLTQGVGRNNPAEAKKVIEEINLALAGQDAWMGRLPGLIEKYGLSWEQAGLQAKQARLDEIARGLIQDFADLTKAGFNVEDVTKGMSTAINDYVSQAIRTGTEIPAAMKPLLQKMIEMGALTDDAGNKLLDLEGLTFAETMTEGFKGVVDAIKELTRALTGGVTPALETIAWTASSAADDAVDSFRRIRTAADEVYDSVTAISFGHSPGGIKEIPIQLGIATDSAAGFAGLFGASMTLAEGVVKRVSFADPIISQFDLLIEKLTELIDRFDVFISRAGTIAKLPKLPRADDLGPITLGGGGKLPTPIDLGPVTLGGGGLPTPRELGDILFGGGSPFSPIPVGGPVVFGDGSGRMPMMPFGEGRQAGPVNYSTASDAADRIAADRNFLLVEVPKAITAAVQQAVA